MRACQHYWHSNGNYLRLNCDVYMSGLRLLRSVFHTPVAQLMHRMRLILKRRSLTALARMVPSLALPCDSKNDPLSATMPLPLWPVSESDVSEESGVYRFRFLNDERHFTLPINWHRSDLNTGTRLWKLNLHYFDYADTLGDEVLSALVTDWIRGNRPYREGYWLDSWNSYALSIRVVAWMGEHARRHQRLDPSCLMLLANSVAEQLRFLLNNLELDIGGNHLVKNIKALYWGGRFFNGPLARRCTSKAQQLLARELDVQVFPDGFHFELSPAYHAQVFGDLLDCWRLMPDGMLRRRLSSKLGLMAQIVADFTHPDGSLSLFNDGGRHMTHSPASLLDAYEALFGWRPNPRARATYGHAGYFVLRQPSYYFVYDAGQVGPDGLPAHAHGDIFAFELSVLGQQVFVDCGVFEYNAGSRRARSRSTAAHNTLTLDNGDQCEFWSSFRMGRRARVFVREVKSSDDTLDVDAQHDGYSHLPGNPVHRRVLQATRSGQFTVIDEVSGGRGQQATSRLLLHPSVRIIEQDPHRLLLAVTGAWITLFAPGGFVKVRRAVWWPDFGCEETTSQVVIEHGSAPGRWTWMISLSKV